MHSINLIESNKPIEYKDALKVMSETVEKVIENDENGYLWLLEHPSIYTAGTTANSNELLNSNGFPIHETGRGGKYTYHGPGQRVVYPIFNLNKIQNPRDVKKYVRDLEEVIIQTLSHFGIESFRREGRVGIWVIDPQIGESKIAAIGVRMKKWVTFHGIAINISPNLSHFNGIIPCGISEYGVTSLSNMGINITLEEFDNQLKNTFANIFNLQLITK